MAAWAAQQMADKPAFNAAIDDRAGSGRGSGSRDATLTFGSHSSP